jgi:Delta3-Delta2-enoyl-CoA isomerase
MNLEEVFAKVKAQDDPRMGLIRDGSIFYFVLNDGENTFDNDKIERVNKYLDEVEKSKGPAVLVTVGTGSKNFSTGFDLHFWAQDFQNLMTSIPRMQLLLARFITLPIPTLAVINGHAYAGGLILALCHDFRIMHDGKRRICLSELNLGMPLPTAYSVIMKATVDIQTFRKIHYAHAYSAREALQDRVVQDLYKDDADANKRIQAFAEKFGSVGIHRAGIRNNKEFMFRDELHKIRTQTFSESQLRLMMKTYPMAQKLYKNPKPKKAKL